MVRYLAIAATAFCAVTSALAAEPENPFKNAKVGDYVVYKISSKPFNVEAKTTHTVIAKSDKEVTIRIVPEYSGRQTPPEERKIDLAKPFEPAGALFLPTTAGAKAEKLDSGAEKITIGKKEYSADWQSFKLSYKLSGMAFESELKVWTCKDVNSPVIKMIIVTDRNGTKYENTTEMTEVGSKKSEEGKSKNH